MKKKGIFTAAAWVLGALFLAGAVAAGARSRWFGLAALGETDTRTMEDYSGYRYGYRWDPAEDPVKGVEIDWINGRVEVRSSSSGKIRITEKSDGRDLTDEEKLQLDYDGGVLRIQWNHRRIRLAVLENMRKDLVVEIPRSLLGEDFTLLQCRNTAGDITLLGQMSARRLVLSSASGSISLEQGFTGESADVATTSGEILLGEMQVTQELKVRSVEGNVTLSGRTDVLRLENTGGDVRFAGAARELEASAISGGVTLALEEGPEKAEIRTVSGAVELGVPPQAGGRLTYETVSGRLEDQLGLAPGVTDHSYGLGGGSGEMTVTTTGGDLTVKRSQLED